MKKSNGINGVSEQGFQRIAEAALRQAARSKVREESLSEPTMLKFASLSDVDAEFDRQVDGSLVHKTSHRVWQMKQSDAGGFEVIRAMGETVDQDMGLEPVAQAAPIEPETGPSPVGTPKPLGASKTASLSHDILETSDDARTAGLVRGTRVLVKVGDEMMPGKIVCRTASHFDVLLSNGATSRILHNDASPMPDPVVKPSVMAPVRQAQPTRRAAPAPVKKEAVDSKAKDYWGSYWQEYGRALVRDDLPRSVTEHAEPATPGGGKTPTKKKSYVDIGNIWMADGSKLRTGTVRLIGKGKPGRVIVEDPFGTKAVVREAAILGPKTEADFRAIQSKGTPANKARLLQAAAAALTWEQITSRYPLAAHRLPEVRANIAKGIRIALAGGEVSAKTEAGRAGRQAALAKVALDEKAKDYYKSYYGAYGDDLVKEVRRRVKADLIQKAAGSPKAAKPAPKAPSAKPDLSAQLGAILTAHVRGAMKQAGEEGDFRVTSVKTKKVAKAGTRRTYSGTFESTRVTKTASVTTRDKSFEILTENGCAKAVKIS